MTPKTEKVKRPLTDKQIAALALGRAKRAENLANGITKSKPGAKNSADYYIGLVHGMEMDKRIVRKELNPYEKSLSRLGDFNIEVRDIVDPKVKHYVKKQLSPAQLDALAKGRAARKNK